MKVSTEVVENLVVRAFGLILLSISLVWLYRFGMTDFRAHLRPVMIPVALSIFALALGLFRLSRIATLLASLLLGGMLIIFVLFTVSASGTRLVFNPYLLFYLVPGTIFMIFFGRISWKLLKSWNQPSSPKL